MHPSSDPNVTAVESPDFDFKIGTGHYRGRGTAALIALAIVHLPRAALFGASAYVASPTLVRLTQIVRASFGH
jgi:hypothetical protein